MQAQNSGNIPPELISYAEQIYFNGKIITVDGDFSIREAVAVRDGRILAVGTTAAVQRYGGPKTQRIDLGRKTMIPGIVDTHVHLQDQLSAADVKAVMAKEPKYRDYRSIVKLDGQTLQQALEDLRQTIANRKPDTWVNAEFAVLSVAKEFEARVTRDDLDRVSPNNPLVVRSKQYAAGRINTRGIEEFRKRFGAVPEEISETGEVDAIDERVIVGDLLLEHPLESLYEPFKNRMKAYARYGVTTWASSLTPLTHINIFREIDRRGEMPIRFAFSHSIGVTANPEAWRFYQRLGDLAGMGTEMLWISGSGIAVADREPMEPCTTLDTTKRCPLARKDAERRRALYEMVRNGQRLTSTHVSGDLAADYILDVIEQASADAGFTPEQIRAKSHALDHCGMYPRPDQILRGVKLGIIWNCGADRIDKEVPEWLARDYGEEYAHRWVAPVASILKAGGRVAGHGESVKGDSFFVNASMLVTRTNSKGVVWGKAEAVDRRVMLRMFTIWAAEYVSRADRIGSIEVGKLADFAVLDKDLMAVPDDQLKSIKVLLTVVGGKVVFEAPTFAISK